MPSLPITAIYWRSIDCPIITLTVICMHGRIIVADSVLYCGISCCVQLIHIRSSLWALVISRTTWNVNSSAQTDFENEEHEVLPTMKTSVAWALLNRQNHMHMHNSSSDDKVPKAILSCDGVEEVSKYYPFTALPTLLVSRIAVGVCLAV